MPEYKVLVEIDVVAETEEQAWYEVDLALQERESCIDWSIVTDGGC